MQIGRIAGIVVGGFVLLIPGCTFDKPLKSSTTIHTEVSVASGGSFAALDDQVGAPFEINGGTFDLKLKTRVPVTEALGAPLALGWQLLWLNADASQTLGTYVVTAPTVMTHGSHTRTLSWSFHDTHVPTWSVQQNDRLRILVQPTGGSITPGWDIKMKYTWTPLPQTPTWTGPSERRD